MLDLSPAMSRPCAVSCSAATPYRRISRQPTPRAYIRCGRSESAAATTWSSASADLRSDTSFPSRFDEWGSKFYYLKLTLDQAPIDPISCRGNRCGRNFGLSGHRPGRGSVRRYRFHVAVLRTARAGVTPPRGATERADRLRWEARTCFRSIPDAKDRHAFRGRAVRHVVTR